MGSYQWAAADAGRSATFGAQDPRTCGVPVQTQQVDATLIDGVVHREVVEVPGDRWFDRTERGDALTQFHEQRRLLVGGATPPTHDMTLSSTSRLTNDSSGYQI